MSPFESLRIKNFRFLLVGTVLSNASIWIQQVTLSWLVYQITGSGTMLGSINLVRSMAAIGMIPAAGLLIDRCKRRNVMLLTNGWLFILNFIIALVLLLGYSQLWFLFVFSFLGGMMTTIDNSLRQVVVFDLVPRQITPNAVAMVQTGWSIMRSFGPGVGGFLILWIGAGGNFMVQAGAYALIFVTIFKIQFPVQRYDKGLKSSPIENIREGIKFIIKEPDTRTFMLIGIILPFLIVPTFGILPPIYAKDVFHGGSDILGILISSVGVGGIIGGFAAAFIGRVEKRGMLQMGALFTVCLFLVGFGFCTNLWVALLFLVLSGFFEMIFITTNQTLLQLSIPDHLRGRVTSILNLNRALAPLGGMIAGAGSDFFGGPKIITVIMNGTAALIAILIFIFSPRIRNYTLSEAIARK